MDAWRAEKEKEQKGQNLLKRRAALAKLLQDERDTLQVSFMVCDEGLRLYAALNTKKLQTNIMLHFPCLTGRAGYDNRQQAGFVGGYEGTHRRTTQRSRGEKAKS
jgi:hypothetical protein